MPKEKQGFSLFLCRCKWDCDSVCKLASHQRTEPCMHLHDIDTVMIDSWLMHTYTHMDMLMMKRPARLIDNGSKWTSVCHKEHLQEQQRIYRCPPCPPSRLESGSVQLPHCWCTSWSCSCWTKVCLACLLARSCGKAAPSAEGARLLPGACLDWTEGGRWREASRDMCRQRSGVP